MARFLSVDPSTNSFAFAEWEGNELLNYGKISFCGANSMEKALDAAVKVHELINQLNVECVVIEAPIFANSASVAITLGVAQGVMIGAIRLAGVKKIYNVLPLTWQCGIGNKAFTKAEKQQIRNDYPAKSVSWYRSFERNIRKQKTIDTVNKMFKIEVSDNDIADAIGVGIYANQNMFAFRPKLDKPPVVKKRATQKPVKRVYKKKSL